MSSQTPFSLCQIFEQLEILHFKDWKIPSVICSGLVLDHQIPIPMYLRVAAKLYHNRAEHFIWLFNKGKCGNNWGN